MQYQLLIQTICKTLQNVVSQYDNENVAIEY